MPEPTYIAVAAIVLMVVYFVTREFAEARARKRDVDKITLDQLRRAGSNMKKVHAVKFVLFVPGEQEALFVRNRLIKRGYEAEIQRAASGPGWICEAKKAVLLNRNELIGLRAEFSKIAAQYGGQYRGWMTTAVR
jgi:hypothetical protein